MEADPRRPRNHHHAGFGRLLAALDHLCGRPQVLDAPVRARADEHGVDVDLPHRRSRGQTHVFDCAFGGFALRLVGDVGRLRHLSGDPYSLARVGPPGDEGLQLVGVELHDGVEFGVVVGGQGAPVGNGFVPVLRRVRPALDVGERRLVGGDHSGPSAGFDRHIADRHPGLH